MNRTCYFCKKRLDCDVFWTVYDGWVDTEADCDNIEFVPNADWLEYEALKKENKELKKK